MKLRELLPAARLELLDPRPQKPGYCYLLHVAVAVVQSAFNRLANTGRAWTVGETTLQVVAGAEEYEVSAANIGKVLDVVAYDSANQEGTERQVGFYDRTEVSGDFRGWDWPGATRIAFYRKDGMNVLYAKVRPIPTESQTYYVSFSTGTWAQEASLDDSPLLAMHHHLFVAQIARDALPAAAWSDDAKADDYKRQSLERSLSRRIEEYNRQFDLYTANLNVPRMTERLEAFSIE